jgi:hypothetical protein
MGLAAEYSRGCVNTATLRPRSYPFSSDLAHTKAPASVVGSRRSAGFPRANRGLPEWTLRIRVVPMRGVADRRCEGRRTVSAVSASGTNQPVAGQGRGNPAMRMFFGREKAMRNNDHRRSRGGGRFWRWFTSIAPVRRIATLIRRRQNCRFSDTPHDFRGGMLLVRLDADTRGYGHQPI